MMPADNVAVCRRRLGAALRAIREHGGKSGDAVAAAMKWSPSKVSRYERARTGQQPHEVAKLLDYYRVHPVRRKELLALAEAGLAKGWWEEEPFVIDLTDDEVQAIGLEQAAAVIDIWAPDTIPVLLQTPGYAAAAVAAEAAVMPIPPAQARRLAEIRTRRQRSRRGLRVILGEAALRRRVGDADVMQTQLKDLAGAAGDPAVVLQVIRQDTNTVIAAPFTVFHYEGDPPQLDIVCAFHALGIAISDEEAAAWWHSLLFNHLASAALNPEDSAALIASMI